MQFSLHHNAEDEATWKPINNAVIDESIVLRFMESNMRNDLISLILSHNEKELKQNAESVQFNLPFAVAVPMSLPKALESIKNQSQDLFENPSQRCSLSFSVSYALEIPSFVRL